MIQFISVHAARLGGYFHSGACPDPDWRSSYFGTWALDLFAHQFEHNGAYRRLCLSHEKSPQTVLDWAEIPAVPASAFKELEMTCLPPAARTSVFHSSGTTQQRPGRHFHSPESLALYEDSLRSGFEAHLLVERGEKIRLGSLTPPPDQAPRSSLVHMIEVARQSFGTGDSFFAGTAAAGAEWALDFARLLPALRESEQAGQPIALLGTAFNFVHLLDELQSRRARLKFAPGSRVMETGGYKGRSRSLPKGELHRLIEEFLGVPRSHIICEYGMSELSSQAYDGTLATLSTTQLGHDASAEPRAHKASWAGPPFTPAHSPVSGEGARMASPSKPLLPPACDPKSIPAEEPGTRQSVSTFPRASDATFSPTNGERAGVRDGNAPRRCAISEMSPASRLFRFPTWVRFLVVSPETGRPVPDGETGLLRVFDLANVASVLAVQTEDLVVRHGDGFELLGRAALSEPRGCSLMSK